MDEQTEKSQSTGVNWNELELGVLKFWKENKTFEKTLEHTKNNEPYVFYDGPPFATGTPHYGHILGSTIKDAIGRYQTMRGHSVRRVWGWDCHGLPIENIVEQHLKISGKKQIEEVGIARFNQVCRDNVLNYVKEWGKMVDRMGRWVDFDNSYKTMDTTYMESVWWGLKQIWDKGLIYEDNKVLMYCSRCETPMSNFEIAMDNSYKDVTEHSVYAKFRLVPRQRIVDFIVDEKTFVLAWTTTPWTLPGNTALNIGPDITYVLVQQNDEHYIVAKERLEVLQGEYEVVREFTARNLEGLSYEPLYPGVIPNSENTAHKIFIEDYVTTTDGTGIVHNAAMYGEVDYEAAKKRNLPRHHILNQQGEYVPEMPEHLRGLFFKDADKVVLKELEEKGLVYAIAPYTHSYPHCWRCGTPLYYSALPAWFINIQKIKPRLLERNEDINWYPEHLQHGRFAKSVEGAPDWNISRNRYWATALPFWKCDNNACTNVVCIGSVQELKEQATNFEQVYPNYDSSNLQALDLHRPYIDEVKLKCHNCQSSMTRIPEVVDCWVESASMPFAELHYPFENSELFQSRYPADFVAEYIAQTRAWFYVMHVVGTIIFDKAPFKNVVTTGNILAEDGAKMSKSKKNYPDPYVVIEKYGIDAVRYYLLTAPVMNADDLNFSEKSVAEVGRKLSMILYNVWSFYRMYAKGTVADQTPSSSHILDRWIMARLAQAHAALTQHLDNYNSVKAGRELQDFVTDLSTWYVRRSRERIKAGNEDAHAALQTLGFVLVEITKLMAPFMPFLADFFYKDLTSQESVHLASWSNAVEVNTSVLNEMAQARSLVELGLALRKEQNLKVRQPLSELQYIANKDADQLDAALEAILSEELNVKKVTAPSEILNRASWVSKSDSGMSVSMNTELTSELKQEGVARELERQVQDLRKKSGLQIGELVDLYYNTTDEELIHILNTIFDRKKTFVNQIKTSLEVEADFETQGKVEGKPIWLGVVKV